MNDVATPPDPAPTAPRPPASRAVLATLLGALALLLIFPTGAVPGTTLAVALLLTTAWALTAVRDGRPNRPAPPAATRRLSWGLAAAAVVMLLYVLPLPVALSGLGSARRLAQNTAADNMLKTAEAMDWLAPEARGYALTRNKVGSLRWSLMMLGATAAFLLTARLPPASRRVLMRGLLLGGVVVAAGGLASLQRWPQGDTLWWVYPVDHSLPGPLACFRNRNHFAAFLAMLIPLALALIADDRAHRRWLPLLASLTALPLLGLALILSLSRGALLATAAGLLALLLLLAASRHWRVAASLALLGALAAGALLLTPHPAVRERLATLANLQAEDSYQTRLSAWRDARAIVRAYPLIGAGANGFRLVYPQHRTTSQSASMTHAENEYVQGMVDGGLLGLLLTLTLLGLAALAVLPPTRHTGRTFGILPFAGWGAVATIAANALVDFPLHIPIYATAAAMCAGLLLPPPSPPADRALRLTRAPALIVFGITALMILAWGRHLHLDSSRWVSRAPVQPLARALTWAPTSHLMWYRLGQLVALHKTPESRLFAEQCYQRAVAYDPLNYRLWERVGYARFALGDRAGARAAFAEVKALRDWMWVPEVEVEP